ncbi:DNA-(apurinic or apyrimidinic site) endonuclease 2 [Scleropages formosus]|uniref:DNA-(apurinic or apyrimidinic site) endonuclease n=1 Tax=Scleropages formosus TaxID=113540 RepID=A0A8C9RGQ1_SCLFO|nr:DNA-(apurinic or apyrimidinic site) lyase 2 [Scleropages formosus]
MKIVTWNINGIRAFKGGVKKALDVLDADIVCLQETKVTRDLLDERTAIVEGYNSYFSFSRGRSGYSGVATFCKDSATPVAAEEGLTGLLTSHDGAVGCYGDQNGFSAEELQLLDNEGRAVITQHKVKCEDSEETLTVLNVYCPRADPEKPERKQFKLHFYRLLQARAEAILESGSHVIVLGDINTSHKPIDHCDPADVENFQDHPGRKWLNSFLIGECKEESCSNVEEDEEAHQVSQTHGSGGRFVDTFRYFHPTRSNAFTCWSTLTGARQTNYGTRIDYIFADRVLVETRFLEADIMPEVEGSDHCPVQGHLRCIQVPGSKCPPLCTRYLPEFAGKQQKLSRFLVKVDQQASRGSTDSLPSSQESGETCENQNPVESFSCGKRKGLMPEPSASKSKKSKTKRCTGKPQGNLLEFFKPKPDRAALPSLNDCGRGSKSSGPAHPLSLGDATLNKLDPAVGGGGGHNGANRTRDTGEEEPLRGGTALEEDGCGSSANRKALPLEEDGGAGSSAAGGSLGFWKSVLRGPPQPPLCKVHQEPCVLRTVKKAGANMGRQFFVCARPQGHASNPQARCNFFAWVDKGK